MNEDVFNNQSANKQSGSINSRWLILIHSPIENEFWWFLPVTAKNNLRVLIIFFFNKLFVGMVWHAFLICGMLLLRQLLLRWVCLWIIWGDLDSNLLVYSRFFFFRLSLEIGILVWSADSQNIVWEKAEPEWSHWHEAMFGIVRTFWAWFEREV